MADIVVNLNLDTDNNRFINKDGMKHFMGWECIFEGEFNTEMEEEMRIAILSIYPPKKCGIANYTYPLVQEFKKSNKIEKIVVIGDLESTKADYMANFHSAFLYRVVKRIIKKEKIDLLYIEHEYWMYGKINLGFIGVHKKINIPLVTKLGAISSNDEVISRLECIRAKIVEWFVKKYVNKLVVDYGISTEQLAGFPLEKVVRISLGVSTKAKIHKKGKDNKKTILFFGMISPHKGVENLIKSSKYLKDVRIVIAGNPTKMNLKEKIYKLREEYSKYNEIILYFGWMPDDKMDEYFSSADVVVLPYTRMVFQAGVLYDAIGSAMAYPAL